MESQVVIDFVDPHAGEGVVIVSAGNGQVGVCLSLKSDGDTEVWMPISEAKSFAAAITRAIEIAQSQE